MNVLRTASYGAARAFQLFIVLVGLLAFVSQSGLLAASGDTGEALALRAALRMATSQSIASTGNASSDSQHTPAGKALLSRHLMHTGVISRSFANGSSTVPIPGSVQTFDLFNPPPAFQPLIGYGTPTAVGNNPADPPIYLNNLTPLNLTPVWSQDETFLIFSSDRTLQGGIQADHRFHLWAISVNGGEAYQITSSSGKDSGGEFFPAMASADNRIAFTSDAQTPGDALNAARQNLYVIPFSYSVLTASNNAPSSIINVNDVTTILPYTNRGNDSSGAPATGFDQVQRPTFSPGNNDLVVFSAHSVTGNYHGRYHIYYLYLSTSGFDPNITSLPAKLTDGPADDTDPAYSKDGQFIAFASTATQLTNQGSPSSNAPNTTQSLTHFPDANGLRNLFLIGGGSGASSSGLGTVPPQLNNTTYYGRVTTTANTDNYGPAWSSVAYNQYTNTNPGFEYLAFARATASTTAHDIYYLQAVSGLNSTGGTGGGQTISPENSTVSLTTGGNGSNAVVKLNTDDNGAPNSVPANSYDDVYPTWSPFRSIFKIAYQSGSVQNVNSLSGTLVNGTVFGGRTVTYNDPATGYPSETAFSVGANGTVASTTATGSYTVASSYIGILQSEVLNLNPPTLLRYSADEIIHVQAGTLTGGVAGDPSPIGGTPTKTGINPGQAVTFTVRLSDREAGINNGNNSDIDDGPTDPTKPQVFIQIKNPNSKYQDPLGMEHKVFARDGFYRTQANHPANDRTSDTVNGFSPYGGFLSMDGGPMVPGRRDLYPTFGLNYPNSVGEGSYIRGAHGGFYQQNGNNLTPTTIFVGKDGGGTNPNANVAASVYPTDPRRFISWGPEYECQFINPQYAGPDPVASEYATPYWLAGVDDQTPFSGQSLERPTMNGEVSNAEWLQLTKSATQDNLGGVLYTVSWKTPASGSDFYLDVIAFDQAVFPSIPIAPVNYAGNKVNWRIYDNVGGFSTNTSIGSNDILVVSDNTLGQKFASTTFGGTNGNLNLVPKLYGAESQITDVDVDILPDAVYAGYPTDSAVGPPNTVFVPAIAPMAGPWLNGLGVGSYTDNIIDDGGRIGGKTYVASQKYSIWRILSRGPLPQSILNSYLPTKQLQPEVIDKQASSPAYTSVLAATVLDAHRCVLWISPYTGDLLADPGTIDDPGAFNRPGAPDRQSTQTILRGFVQGGGRLFVTGQDVGSTLTTGGSVANGAGGFLSDVLGASLASSGGGTFQLGASRNRISYYPTFDAQSGANNGTFQYPVVVNSIPNQYVVYQGGEPVNSRLEISGANSYDPNFASDGSLSQRSGFSPTGFTGANLLGQPDTLTPSTNTTVAMTYSNGAAAMVIHDDPYNPQGTGKLPGGGTGGRTVYAGFGLEALSNDAYSSDGSNPSTGVPPNPPLITYIPTVAPRNPRANILHNIVGYLRTGSVSGIITQTAGSGAGAGQGVPGVTVYLVSATGQAPPTRVTFSAKTSSDGHFTILGVEPGRYALAAYKPGYAHAASNAGISFIVEGDASVNASLTITPQPPGNIAGNVHDTSGKPVVSATVSFLSKDKTIVKSTTTFDGSNPLQPAGNYFLPSVPVTDYSGSATGPSNNQGNPEYLAATAPDAPYATDVNVRPSTTTGDGSAQGGVPVTFTLTPILATISGRIFDSTVGNTDAGGAKVSGATLAVLDSTGSPLLDATGNAVVGTAGADGKYTIIGIPATQAAATYTISVTKAGYTSASFAQIVYLGGIYINKDQGLGPIPPGTITGSVKDQAGVPVSSAKVTFTTTDGTVVTVVTDASGNFTIAAPPGTYSGTAVGPNNPNGRPVSSSSAPQTVTVTSGATATANFVVTTIPPSFAGIISDSTGKALPGAAVAVYVANADGSKGALVGSVPSAADGTYSTATFVIPPGGTYIVEASLAGYTSARLVKTPAAGATPAVTTFTVYNGDALTAQNIALTSVLPGSISGIVSDTAGNPIAGVAVTFVSADKTQTYTATTDTNGAYTKLAVKSATYVGTATSKPGYTDAAPQTFTVSPGINSVVNFTLAPILPTVTGQVTDGTTGTALGNVKVTFTPTAGGTPVVVTSNAGGTYASGPLPAGAYSVTASAPSGYFDSTQAITLALGDTRTLNFPLAQKGTLIGYVTDATTGQPVLGVSLAIKDAVTGIGIATLPTPLTTVGATTGPDGSPINYLAGLPPGTYTVTATKGNYAILVSAPVTVGNGPFVRLDLKLISTIGTLGGLVTDSSSTNPIAGAAVTVQDSSGTVVATFSTVGAISTPPSPGGDSNPLNYSGQLSNGTYTVIVSKGSRKSVAKTVTVVGGKFNRLDFTGALGGLPALHTFAAGLNFLSAPYDYSSVSFDTLFGNLNTAPAGTTPNGNRSHVAVWNPVTSAYAVDPSFPADSLRLGTGYWIFLKNPVSFTAQGGTPTTPTVSVSLHPFWNQIGVPNVNGIKVSALLFDNGHGGTITFADAVSSRYNVVSPTLYRFDGSSYQVVTAADTLLPYQAYWIKANVDATLLMPTQ